MTSDKDKRTEHSGAKNGGGHWGTREEAKSLSKKTRRANSKKIIENEKQKFQRKANDQTLIESSQTAIEICQKKMGR